MTAAFAHDLTDARRRFVRFGAEGISDREHLALLVGRAAFRGDAAAAADKLLHHWGSFAEALNAPGKLLGDLGLSRSAAFDISLLAAIPQRVLASRIAGRKVMSSWVQVLDYCRAAMAFEEREQFRILFLDKKNALIADEVQQRGTIDHTPVYPREVVKRALELNATAIILVHNHPSGDPAPSSADIDMTRMVIAASKPLGIRVHDHIIIGKKGHSSMKGLQLI